MSFFSRKKTGSLITRVSSDTDRLWEFLAFGVIDVSLSFVMIAGLGTVLLGLDWQLGLVMVLPVPYGPFNRLLGGRPDVSRLARPPGRGAAIAAGTSVC